VRGNDAELLLLLEDDLAVLVPPHVELALVLVGPFLCDVVGRMARGERQEREPRLVGGDGLVIREEGDRLIDDVLGEVIALLGKLRLIDGLAIEVELRVPLAAIAAEKSVEAIETEHGPVGQRSYGPAALVSSDAVLCHLPSANEVYPWLCSIAAMAALSWADGRCSRGTRWQAP